MLALGEKKSLQEEKEFFCSVLKSYRAYNHAGYRVLLATPRGLPLAKNVADLVDPFHGVNFPLDAQTLPIEDAHKFRAIYVLSDADTVDDLMQMPLFMKLRKVSEELGLLLALQTKDSTRIWNCDVLNNPEIDHVQDAYEQYTKSIIDVISAD